LLYSIFCVLKYNYSISIFVYLLQIIIIDFTNTLSSKFILSIIPN
ncbi:unnamed protein product, partial [marine sediment metagenome]